MPPSAFKKVYHVIIANGKLPLLEVRNKQTSVLCFPRKTIDI